jgi:hypothetical protein
MDFDHFTYIPNGRWQMGCEVECCIKRAQNRSFEKQLKSLHKGIEFEYDGSLRPIGWSHDNHNSELYYNRGDIRNDAPFDQGHELLTPVLPVKDASLLLIEIFRLIEKDGYTNKSCGLHVNFSPINKSDYGKINPFYLVSQPIWNEIREVFGRMKNKYCKNIFVREDICKNPTSILEHVKHGKFWDKYDGIERTTDYKHLNAISLWRYMVKMQQFNRFNKQRFVDYKWHYSVVNFDHYTPLPAHDSRIEVRGFGNKNYHLRLEEIISYIEKIIELFENSMNFTLKDIGKEEIIAPKKEIKPKKALQSPYSSILDEEYDYTEAF